MKNEVGGCESCDRGHLVVLQYYTWYGIVLEREIVGYQQEPGILAVPQIPSIILFTI